MVVVRIKKYNVCHDELFLRKKNGLYCLLPFEKLDKKKNAVFKVGMTSQDLAGRIENYHTYYPLGLYICFFLSYPRIQNGEDKKKIYRQMEKKLIANLKETDAKMLIFPSRPSMKSEWFYANWTQLQNAFRQVQTEYGGVLHEFSLDSINNFSDIFLLVLHYSIVLFVYRIE